MALTDTTVLNAKPKEKPYKLGDSGGLFVIVRPNGAKWWRLKYHFGGKEKLLSLGVYPDVSLQEARRRRDEYRQLLANGVNPSNHRKDEHAATKEAVTTDMSTARARSLRLVREAGSEVELSQTRVRLLGRKGEISALFKNLGSAAPEERRRLGAEVNALKIEIAKELEAKAERLADVERNFDDLADMSLPGLRPRSAGLHPTTQMICDLNDAFVSLNFDIYEGPQVSSELYEFDHLNFAPDHPARESMDTYWIAGTEGGTGAGRLCLRPHLTGASVRYMRSHEPPFRLVYPGRVYRNESTDARHERAFFQYEALIVDRDIPFTAGQVLISTILNTVFGRPVRTRMRVGFFPFVEPGFEIDMECLVCAGAGCRLCKHVGWLEVMPGGAPHPNVFRAGGLDPDEWMGFYINVGLDRLVMMRYGIEDVRRFHSADLRFLRQFR
jgi:phenylalanyl-tRNA synthetase alpha chain